MLADAAPTGHGTTLDYIVIFAYLGGILLFGSFFARFSKSTKEFFFSGQRFSWWLICLSIVATGVGSHSFMKYSQVGYEHGLSSSMAYMNDWFFMPFFMLGWLPIIYFSRVRSIPEYFQRRFNTPCRFVAVLILLMYMIGYIGYNLFTLGTAANQVLGVDVTTCIVVIAVVSAIYIASGGQTAVIFTDVAQGIMLIVAGLTLFVLGLDYLALDGTIFDGLRNLWAHLGLRERLPFAHFNSPPEFNFVNIFWQDGVAGSIMFLFVSQGLIMRFLAAKSVNEGRKAILFNTLLFLPISMVVVSNAGWVAHAAVAMGLMESPDSAAQAFVKLAAIVCMPGVFGFVLAALSAALMSTIDTLTNATAALFVYDVYQPYVAHGRSDRHYLRVARIASLTTSAVGLGLGLYFATRGDNLYKTHAAFLAIVTPPIIAAVFLGAFSKRFTPAGAMAAMAGGALCIWISKLFPQIVAPFATWLHGVQPEADGGYSFMTALFGLVVSGLIGVAVSTFTRPKPESEIAGLWIGSVDLARGFFKGGTPNFRRGRKVRGALALSEDGTTAPGDDPLSAMDAPAHQPPAAYAVVRLGPSQMRALAAEEGDLIYIGDARSWLGGLRSLHCRVGPPHFNGRSVLMSPAALREGNLVLGRPVVVEKLF